MAFKRITVDSGKMGGVPSIRGLRVPVATVVGMVADGMDEEEILKAYPDLERRCAPLLPPPGHLLRSFPQSWA